MVELKDIKSNVYEDYGNRVKELLTKANELFPQSHIMLTLIDMPKDGSSAVHVYSSACARCMAEEAIKTATEHYGYSPKHPDETRH